MIGAVSNARARTSSAARAEAALAATAAADQEYQALTALRAVAHPLAHHFTGRCMGFAVSAE